MCPYSSKSNFQKYYPTIPVHKDDINPTTPHTHPRPKVHHPPPAFASPSQDANNMDEDADEISNLREQICILREQQNASQQAATSTADSVTALALAQMAEFFEQSQQLNQQIIAQLASKPTDPVKEPPMPKWGGNITTKDLYLEQQWRSMSPTSTSLLCPTGLNLHQRQPQQISRTFSILNFLKPSLHHVVLPTYIKTSARMALPS
jgi:hypothetical protein